jgi:hypothetical protein
MALSPGRAAELPTSTAETFSLHSLIHDRHPLRSALTVERFRFRASESGRVTLSAVLTYEYAPAILKVQRMNIRLAEAERIIY